MKLKPSQLQAITYVNNNAFHFQMKAKATIDHILQMSNIKQATYDDAIGKLKKHAKIALHFHPDRPDTSMKTVAEALLEQGIYKSQFETRISNGSVSAFPGGARELWETQMFGGAYRQNGTNLTERPKYGALNLMLHPDGPAPRFGSCYFLLSPEASKRSTYTYLDSHNNPTEKGTYEQFDFILATLLEEIFNSDFALGEHHLTPPKFIHHLQHNLTSPLGPLDHEKPYRNLNHYIEAQVHGDVSLREDVEILVADPSFRHTKVGHMLEQMCNTYTIDLHWHMGFALSLKDVPNNFRGPKMPILAKRISDCDYIDTSMIGTAVMNVKSDPASWSDFGSVEEVVQQLKLLWHVLVKYGKALKCFD